LIHKRSVFYLYTAFIGLFAGGFFGLLRNVIGEYFGDKNFSVIYCFVLSVSSIGALFGIPLIGAIIENRGYELGGITGGCFIFIGTCIVSLISYFPKENVLLIPHRLSLEIKQ